MKNIKEKIKRQWDENIKHFLMFVVVGVCITAGMRLADIALPEVPSKVLVCFVSNIGVVSQCDSFKPQPDK